MHSTEFEDPSLAVSLKENTHYYGKNFMNFKAFALSKDENWHYILLKICISTGNAGLMKISGRKKY